MSTRDRIKPPERSRRHSEGESRHARRDEGRREKITNRTAHNKDPRREEHDQADLDVENGTTLRDTRNKERNKESSEAGERIRKEEKKRNKEERRPARVTSREGGGRVERRGSRTDRFRNERDEHVPSQPGDGRAGRKSEGRLEEGRRISPVEGEWRWRGRQRNVQGEGYGEMGENEPSLYSSQLDVAQIQIDPQEVPRKGFFYEHDNREAALPLERTHQMTRRRRFVERTSPPGHIPYWREREDQDLGREREREYRSRRHSSDKPYHRRREVGEEGGGRSRGEGERRNREESRMDRGNRWSGDLKRARGVGREGEHEEGGKDGWREERQQRRSPARWRHDKFEVDEPDTDQHEAGQHEAGQREAGQHEAGQHEAGQHEDKEEQRKSWNSGINKTWGHDKYEELVLMETESTS